MIHLYLIRHGVAEERGEAWPDDSKRPLTEKGMSKLRKAARGLTRLDLSFDVIVSSPATRCRQTADIIAGALDPRPPVVCVETLGPGGNPVAILADLEKHTKRAGVALVGHEPWIGELAARLIASRHPMAFKKGAICCVDVESLPPAGPGTLRWFLTPRQLREIAGRK